MKEDENKNKNLYLSYTYVNLYIISLARFASSWNCNLIKYMLHESWNVNLCSENMFV